MKNERALIASNEVTVPNYQLAQPSKEYDAMRKLIVEARGSFLSRYMHANEATGKPLEELSEDGDFEFTMQLMDTTATMKGMLERRMGKEKAQKFVDGFIAWHAAIKSGIGGKADITKIDFPDRVQFDEKTIPFRKLKATFEDIIYDRHPMFHVEPPRASVQPVMKSADRNENAGPV